MLGRYASRAWLALLALSVVACAPAPTQLVVVVDTDIVIPGALDEIAVEVRGPTGGPQIEIQEIASADEMPMTLGVAPSSEQTLGPIDVVAIGRHDGTEVVRRHHRVTLVRGESRTLLVHLALACIEGSRACRAGETCGENGCLAIDVDGASLPPWTGTPPRLHDDAGAPRDAGLDGAIDATVDAAGDGGQRCGSAAECDDLDPCTDDSCATTGCVHAPNAASCDDGMFCNGLDRCVAGACAHDGDPCRAPTSCVESANVCMGCMTAADCPSEMAGAWATCVFTGDACSEGGMQSRVVRSFVCMEGGCAPSDRTESQACVRETDGDTCAGRACPEWSACGGFDSGCDESGVVSRTCTTGTCVAGACALQPVPESMPCTRSTAGNVCGGGGCDGWGSCSGFAGTCGRNGQQSRTCQREDVCSGGGCSDEGTYVETQACSRSTDGVSCGGTDCTPWGACGGFAGECSTGGTQTRDCSDYSCSGGGCAASTRTETQSCSRGTDGNGCNDGYGCSYDDHCESGNCVGFDECQFGDCYCAGTYCRASGGGLCPF